VIRLVDPERHNTYDRNEMIFVLNIEESYSQAWLCSIGANIQESPPVLELDSGELVRSDARISIVSFCERLDRF